MDEREDEDVFKYDADPKGWAEFYRAHDQQNKAGLPIASKVGLAMPEDGDVQYKTLRLFLRYKESDLALRSALNLVTHSPTNVKAKRGLQLFNEYSKNATFENKEDLGNFETLYKAFKAKKLSFSNMVEVQELLKQDSKNAKQVLASIAEDPIRMS